MMGDDIDEQRRLQIAVESNETNRNLKQIINIINIIIYQSHQHLETTVYTVRDHA